MRKMSSYLGFNGEELALFIELRDVFKLMNHNDSAQNFRREIKLFERCIKKLTELYQNGGNLNAVSGWGPGGEAGPSISAGLGDVEGGNQEMMSKLDRMAANAKKAYKDKVPGEAASDSNSDITAKPVTDI